MELNTRELAKRIETNRRLLRDKDGTDWMFLFPDWNYVRKIAPEDFARMLADRVLEHRQAMDKRRARLHKEREAEDARAAQQAEFAHQRAAQVFADEEHVQVQANPSAPVQDSSAAKDDPLLHDLAFCLDRFIHSSWPLPFGDMNLSERNLLKNCLITLYRYKSAHPEIYAQNHGKALAP